MGRRASAGATREEGFQAMARTMGTRVINGYQSGSYERGSFTRHVNSSPGMSKMVTDNLTFANTGTVTGSNGDFAAFVVRDPVLFQGTNLNNGLFEIVGIDVTNHAYLVISPAPQNEGPVSATARTP
jgi:hypothetical protein